MEEEISYRVEKKEIAHYKILTITNSYNIMVKVYFEAIFESLQVDKAIMITVYLLYMLQ